MELTPEDAEPLRLEAPTAQLLPCDAARLSDGKLSLLGAGWSGLRIGSHPAVVAVAILTSVPWEDTNRPLPLSLSLVDAEGDLAYTASRKAVYAEWNLEAGRPHWLKPGEPQHLPVTASFHDLALEPGSYRWELELDGELVDTWTFDATRG